MDNNELEYVGFWMRVLATLIDAVLLLIVTLPFSIMVYGGDYLSSNRFILGPADFLINWVAPAVIVILFWVTIGQTPGKAAIGARIVDADTGGPISAGTAILRYLGYSVSFIVLSLGYLWVGFDARKQGWHDHLAGTVVVRRRRPVPVTFGGG